MRFVSLRLLVNTLSNIGTRSALPALFAATLAACGGSDPGGTSSGAAGGGGSSTTSASSTSASSTSSGAGGGGGATSGAGGGGGAGGAGGGGASESVTLRAEPCAKAPPSATRCESYDVVCGGNEPAVVELSIFEPAAGTPKVGVIVFGSGGDGTGFYNFVQRKQLLSAGFTVIDRRWPSGWFTGASEGPQQASCRYAALLRFLRSTVASEGLLCATGNSGGSAELGYALTWQGAGKVLDFAMPTSGPFHRLDLACQGQADAAWTSECATLKSSECPDCASTGCQLGNGPRSLLDVSFGGTPRCTMPGAGDLALLEGKSPIAGPNAATLDGAPTHFLVGKDDPGAYQPLATALHDALAATGAKVKIDFVTGAPHEMDTTMEGAIAIRDTLLAECVPKP